LLGVVVFTCSGISGRSDRFDAQVSSACGTGSMFGVLHVQTACLDLLLMVCCYVVPVGRCVWLCLLVFAMVCGMMGCTEKFPTKVLLSGVITSAGVSSLVMYPVGTRLDAATYLDTLKRDHIPLTRKVMRNQPFVFIHVRRSRNGGCCLAVWLRSMRYCRV